MSLADFFSMGGYGVYVWSSYAISLVALALNIILPKMKERKTMQALQKRLYAQADNKQ
jgi:heme exporter protein D